jgi:organic radical activating enzyme
MSSKLEAPIAEIFTSIQGEGIFLGVPQIFIRFADCNLNCQYCDTKINKSFSNFTPQDLKAQLKNLNGKKVRFHSLALTGGEPLLHSAFLKQFLPLVHRLNLKIYLETNGTLPRQLREIIKFVDIIAMDMKLPSATGERPLWREHREFLRTAGKKCVFVKLVVTETTLFKDIKKAGQIVKAVNYKVPVILQPDFNFPPARLLAVQAELKQTLFDVRIIPQMHKILGVE